MFLNILLARAKKKDLFPPAVKNSRFDATKYAGTQLLRLNIRIAKKALPTWASNDSREARTPDLQCVRLT
jgi:hypothetical protein